MAIFGTGRVAHAMAHEMPDAPIVSRGEDVYCDIACVTWPAHALDTFRELHPKASRAYKVAFCNGMWAKEEGMDEAGICYVRASKLGDFATGTRKAWRVGPRNDVAAMLKAVGLNLVRTTRADRHRLYLWEKAMYLLPLAFACEALIAKDPTVKTRQTMTAKLAKESLEYAEWYDIVEAAAVAEMGMDPIMYSRRRVEYLLNRLPKTWRPSPSSEELAYFREKLCAA